MMPLKSASLILFVLLSISACKKDRAVDNSFSASMSFKLNGKLQQSNAPPVADLFVSNNTNTMQIVGRFNDTEGMSLSLKNPAIRTYDVVKDTLVLVYTTQPDYNYAYIATSGSLTITSITDANVTGTFQFTGTNGSTATTRKITEGKFAATINKL